MIRILLADNQPLTRAGINHFLSVRKDFEVVGEASDSVNLLKQLKIHQPDLLIVDYQVNSFLSPNDFKEIFKVAPDTNALVISNDNEKASILQVLETGIKGYITKECSEAEIINAIFTTAKGGKFFCNKIFDILMERHLEENEVDSQSKSLTVRETEILKLIAEGNATLKIADLLNLSKHTVNTHRKNIIKKLGIKSPTELIIYALDMGIIKIND